MTDTQFQYLKLRLDALASIVDTLEWHLQDQMDEKKLERIQQAKTNMLELLLALPKDNRK